MQEIPGYIATSRELDAQNQRKEGLERELKELNIQIGLCESKLVREMSDASLTEFRDEATGKRFKIDDKINVKASDYAKLNDSRFAQAFKRRKFNIFKWTVHAQTLGATVRKEIMTTDRFGQFVLPKWAEKYIEIETFSKISISK